MRFWKIFKKKFKKKQDANPTPRIEKDTKCDKCEYLQMCIDEGGIIDCRILEDSRSHYIRGIGARCRHGRIP